MKSSPHPLPGTAAFRGGVWPPVALLLVTAAAALGVAFSEPFAQPMPGYLVDAQLWADTGRIADTFTPLAYPLFIGPALRWGGVPGVVALQVLLHILLAAIAYGLLRELALPPRFAAIAALAVALHPDLLASVTKAWDVSLSTALLLLLVLLCLVLLRGNARVLTAVALLTGLAAGIGIACRPNYLFLLPCVLAALLLRSPRPPARSLVTALAAVLLAAASSFALVGVLSHGSPFLPRNGTYNLFAGHNPYTADALRRDLNAEPSLVRSLGEASSPPDRNPYAVANTPWYKGQAIAFARSHPGAELAFIPLKLWTLFRPDTKVHPLGSPLGLVRALLALPLFLLLGAILWPPQPRLRAADDVLLLFEALYILPFLITNADPRFRTPLDMLLLLHAGSLLWRRLRGAPERDRVLPRTSG